MCLSGKTKFYFCGKNLRTCLFVSLLTGQKIVLERFRLIGQNFWKNKSLQKTSVFVCKALESDNLIFPARPVFEKYSNDCGFFLASKIRPSFPAHPFKDLSYLIIVAGWFSSFFQVFFCWECEIHLGKDKENIGSSSDKCANIKETFTIAIKL